MKNSAIVGFSANAELVFHYDRMSTAEKGKLEQYDVALGGTSANVARVITKLGQKAKLLALTGVGNDAESNSLRFVLDQYQVPYEEFKILNKSHFSILPIDGLPKPKIFGEKGKIQEEFLDKVIQSIENRDETWRIATAIRPEEMSLVKTLFNKHEGYRTLNPHMTLISNEDCFKEVLLRTDMLIVSSDEFDACNVASIEHIHEFGPHLVVVTQDERGGIFSIKGLRPEKFLPCTSYIREGMNVYGPGAGDWFSGGLHTYFLENERSIFDLSLSKIKDAINFAAKVAGKKVTMPGATNGPGKEDL